MTKLLVLDTGNTKKTKQTQEDKKWLDRKCDLYNKSIFSLSSMTRQ